MQAHVRNRWLPVLAISCLSCSLVVDPRQDYEYDIGDGGMDAGSRSDARSDGGPVDSGTPRDAAQDPLEPPVLRFPWNGYTTGSVHTGELEPPLNALRPRFIWEAVPGATHYDVALTSQCEARTRNTCAFSEALTESVAATDWRPTDSLDVATSAPVGRRYYWRVRACRSGVCSNWSDVRYLDVGRQPADLNGDGYADVLTSGVIGDTSSTLAVYFGPDLLDSARDTLEPTSGIARVFLTGDVNSDGYSDALVFLQHSGASAETRAQAVLGGTRPTLSDAVPLHRRCATRAPSFGDLDGDGRSDVALPCPCDPLSTASAEGRVCVWAGNLDGSTFIELASAAPEAEGDFGQSVAASVDLNADGFVDLAVGSAENGGSVGGSGRVQIFAGAEDFEASASSPRWTLISPSPVVNGGFSYVHPSGDVNCDGYGDLMVGENGVSQIHLARGSRDGPAVAYTLESVTGRDTATNGDFNGDGAADILDRPPGTDLARAWGGACEAGFSDSPQDIATPGEADDGFSEEITIVGDIDGDGRDEVGFGAPYATTAMRSRIFVFAWNGTALASTVTLERPYLSFPGIGFSVAGLR